VWIGRRDEFLRREPVAGIVAHDRGDGRLIVIAGNRARHVEQSANGDVIPRRILRQPLAELVIDRQLPGGLKMQDGDGRERFRDAADLEEFGRRDRRARLRVFGRAGGKVDVRLGALQADAQRRRGDVLRFRARCDVVASAFCSEDVRAASLD
jgi:hypothetical protein